MLEGLSIGTVAISAGMSKSGVFAHFGSRSSCSWRCSPIQWARAPRRLRESPLPCASLADCPVCASWQSNGVSGRARIERGCVLLSAAVEYDGRRDGAIREHVLRQQTFWRDELRRAIGLAVDAGHLKKDTDTTQLAFEIYSLMLGPHHDAGLPGYDEARQLTERALERLFTSYSAPCIGGAPVILPHVAPARNRMSKMLQGSSACFALPLPWGLLRPTTNRRSARPVLSLAPHSSSRLRARSAKRR